MTRATERALARWGCSGCSNQRAPRCSATRLSWLPQRVGKADRGRKLAAPAGSRGRPHTEGGITLADAAVIPCVAYAAKSSPDEKDATGTQLAEVRTAVERAGGRVLVGTFSEENVSGFKSERGPQLQAAMTASMAAAAEHDGAELWVAHSSRLARGDGTKGHQSLLKVYADLLYEGVRLRSVHDDPSVCNPAYVGMASDQNNKYSRDLSTWVKGGKDRQMRDGERLGGPPPDGLRRVVTVDDRGRSKTHYELDATRAKIILRAFELSESGMGDTSVALKLNAEGYRTQAGNTWRRRRVQDTLTNPAYAGRVVRFRGKPNEEVTAATDSPALIDGDRFDALRAARANRDRSAAGRAKASGGRPTGRYVLSRLAICERCLSSMYCVTSPYKRKDGSQARHYVCKEVYDQTGTCDAPKVPAEAADTLIVPHLRGFFCDFDAWLNRVSAAEAADRDAVRAQITHARTRLGTLTRAETAARDRYAAALASGEASKADAIEGALSQFTAERAQTAALIADREAVLSELATTAAAPVDRMLDFWNSLSAGIKGGLDAARSVAEVNERLREVLYSVRINTLDDGRVRLQAIFAGRDEWTDENFDNSPTAPPLYPNTLVVASIPTVPTETVRNSQE